MYDLRIVAILTANDDGSQAAQPTAQQIARSVDIANRVYNPHGVNFLFDPATDIYHFNDDLLNRDCPRRDHELYTNKDIDPASLPAVNGDIYNNRRNEVARRFPGRITVFFTAGSRYRWSEDEQRWVYGQRDFSWSNAVDEFVTMAAWHVGNDVLAHELGHYHDIWHTHYHWPKTVDEAAELIRREVDDKGVSKDDIVATLFDNDDTNGVEDTPPDPGSAVFGNPCDPAEASVTIPVTFRDGSTRHYTFAPDRANIMSYWDKNCGGRAPRLTAGQARRVLASLREGNRKHLIEPGVFYMGTWAEGDRSQTRAIAWAMNDFAARFDAESRANRRCVLMRAYDIGQGQIRYDGVWERAQGKTQTRAIAWAMEHFVDRFRKEAAAGRRCVHLQAYDIGAGQIRYDGIWESGGDSGQTWVLAWALEHFAQRFDEETAAQRRCTHLQAYGIGSGQIRYDATWADAPGVQQTRALAWSPDHFAGRFDAELQAGRRCVHLQAYDIGSGQIRYDGIWESGGNRDQTRALAWAFNDFVRRCDEEASHGRKLVHVQAYDLGGGQIRYDGIWERSAGSQKRLVGLSLGAFADRFDELTSSGYHVELMSAYRRTYPSVSAAGQAHRTLQSTLQGFAGSDVERRPAAIVRPLQARAAGTGLPLCHYRPSATSSRD